MQLPFELKSNTSVDNKNTIDVDMKYILTSFINLLVHFSNFTKISTIVPKCNNFFGIFTFHT